MPSATGVAKRTVIPLLLDESNRAQRPWKFPYTLFFCSDGG